MGIGRAVLSSYVPLLSDSVCAQKCTLVQNSAESSLLGRAVEQDYLLFEHGGHGLHADHNFQPEKRGQDLAVASRSRFQRRAVQIDSKMSCLGPEDKILQSPFVAVANTEPSKLKGLDFGCANFSVRLEVTNALAWVSLPAGALGVTSDSLFDGPVTVSSTFSITRAE